MIEIRSRTVHLVPEIWARFRHLISGLVIAAVLLPLTAFALPRSVFYVIGTAGPEVKGEPCRDCEHVLYELDTKTLGVVGSVKVSNAETGMLNGKCNAIILSDDEYTLWRVQAPNLTIDSRFSPGSGPHPGNACLEHTFVHPINGLAYFSCEIGHDATYVVVVDTVKQSVVTELHSDKIFSSHFTFDPKNRWLLLDDHGLVALDIKNQIIGHVGSRELTQQANLKIGDDLRFRAMAVLPNGSWVLRGRANDDRPVLLIYDPATRAVFRSWVENDTFTARELAGHQTPGAKTVFEIYLRLENGPVPSRNGSRLFAISDAPRRYHADSPARGILFDTETLRVLRRWDLPEPPLRNRELEPQCFFQAPDGRGMWYLGESGKIYRLDEQSGELIEQVKLPFRIVNLIHEP